MIGDGLTRDKSSQRGVGTRQAHPPDSCQRTKSAASSLGTSQQAPGVSRSLPLRRGQARPEGRDGDGPDPATISVCRTQEFGTILPLLDQGSSFVVLWGLVQLRELLRRVASDSSRQEGRVTGPRYDSSDLWRKNSANTSL
jgi:hypothetical protein